MSGVEKISRRQASAHSKRFRSLRDRRLRGAILATSMFGVAMISEAGYAATFTTSAVAPSDSTVQISQPDNTGNAPIGYLDYSNNYAGTGQVFTPLTNFSMTSFTFQGGGGAGNTLTGNWNIYVGSLPNNQNYYGAGISLLNNETADGAPIAADVAAGNKTNYNTVTLATPIALVANQRYFWAIHSPNGYYQLAGTPTAPGTYNQNTTSTEYPGGESMHLDPTNSPPTSEIQLQNADRTFFISGTVAVSTTPQWAVNANGNWQVASNWSTNTVPQFTGDSATFGNDGNTITISPVVTLSSAVTVDSITFSAPSGAPNGGYTVSDGGNGQIRTPLITVISGNHTIAPALTVKSYTNNDAAFVVDPGASLTVNNLVDAVGYYHNVSITGGGTLSVDKLSNAAFDIEGSTLTFPAGGAPSTGIFAKNNNGSTWNINTAVTVEQYYDSGSSFLNIGSTGSLTSENGNGVFINATISGSGPISIGGGANPVSGSYGELNGTNSNYSGGILVSNGYILRLGGQYGGQVAKDSALGNASATNTLTLDNGTLLPVNGFSGTHQIIINSNGGTIQTTDAGDAGGTGSGPFNVGIGSVSGPGALTVAGGGTVIVAPQVVALNASGGIRSLSLGSVTLTTSGLSLGTAALQSNRTVLSVGALAISGATDAWTGLLDLGGNDLVVHNGDIVAIANQLKQGYAGGTWQGSGGIVSSAAASDPSHLTTLGFIINNANAAAVLSTFDGASVTTSDVLVKYTYYGDANLDGRVDGSDYTLIDNGFHMGLTGWLNGDFNNDGVVNGSDYTLIDNAFNTQGVRLASEIATSTAQIAGSQNSASVPEPTCVSLIGIGAVALLGRRAKRRRD